MNDNKSNFNDNGLYDDDKTRVFKPVSKAKRDFFDDDELVDIEEAKSPAENFDAYYQDNSDSYNDGFDMDSQPEEEYYPHSQSKSNRNESNHRSSHSKHQSKKSNTPVVISIIAAVVAVVLTVILVIVFTKGCDNNDTDTTQSSTQSTTTTLNAVATDTTEYVTYREETTASTTEETTVESTTEATTQPPTALPSLINANFLPYKCITPNGDRITSDFNDELGGEAAISLTSDGNYSLLVGSIANCAGTYTIDGNYLLMDSGYTGTVSFDDAGNPVAVIVSVDGYQVYFN